MTEKNETHYTYTAPVLILLTTVWLLIRSDVAEAAALDALKMCATVIIPSLFPYMVISSMIVSTGAADRIGSRLSGLTGAVFRLPGCTGGAVILGALCGFPVGAKTACELYERSNIRRRECERLIAIANNTGPSFVIEVVGAHFWGSRGMGLTIYIAQILSALLIGWISSGKEALTTITQHDQSQNCDMLQCLSQSITHSARSVISVCGFIVFFAVITTLIGQLLSGGHLSFVVPIAAAVLEFSTGASSAADLGGTPGAFLTGFAVGWSGISVFAQCKVFTVKHGISLRFAAICKAIQGLMTGLAASVYYALWFTPSATVSTVIHPSDPSFIVMAGEFLFLAVAAMEIPRRST